MMPQVKNIKDFGDWSTKRLLRYYRSQRTKFHAQGYICGCCQEFSWDIHPNHEGDEVEYNAWQDYLQKLKDLLSTREHLQRTKNGKIA